MSKPPIYLIRHGATAMNKETPGPEKIRGWIDVPLAPKGRADAAIDAEKLRGKKIDHFRASDLSRARESADIMASKLRIPVKESTHKLRPWNLGHFSGKPVSEVKNGIANFVRHPNLRVPGGESFNEFKTRFLSYVMAVKRSAKKPVGLVTHYRNLKLVSSWNKKPNMGVNIEKFLAPDNLKTGSIKVL
jgi:2,3-bisphosphoglycerate-dependent phosphoglycerate mutase